MAFNPADYRQSLTLADGDLRRALADLGVPPGQNPVFAAIDHPTLLEKALTGFLRAGARLLVTPTDTTDELTDTAPAGLEKFDHATRLLDAIRRTARFYRTFADEHSSERPVVIGAIGPSSRLLLLGEHTADNLHAVFTKQCQALAEGGVDAIFCSAFVELDALLIAIRSAATVHLPAIAGMRFDAGADGAETTLGVTSPQAAAAAESAGAAIFAIDAGERPDTVAAVVALVRKTTQLPIWVRISAGFPQLDEGRVVYPESPADFAIRVTAVRNAGADIIGGGPGVTADHLAALAPRRKR